MRIRIWGTRGSLPVSGPGVLRYGGNTPCLSLECDGEPLLVLDTGTGVFNLAKSLGRPPDFKCTIALTHLHWDHMMGLPFFFPADQADAETLVLGPGDTVASNTGRPDGGGLRAGLDSVLRPPGFPITLDGLEGRWRYETLGDETRHLGRITLTARHVRHRGPTLGFRVEVDGAAIAYIPDHGPGAEGRGPEHDDLVPDGVRDLVDGVDLLIHDAHQTPTQYEHFRHFGHCTPEYAVKVAKAGEVGRLLLFHHDPGRDDDGVDGMLDDALPRGGRDRLLRTDRGSCRGRRARAVAGRTPDHPTTEHGGIAVSTPDQLADQAAAALDAGGPDAHLSALRALTEAVREQTKAIAALTESVGAAPSAGATQRAAPPKRLMKPPAPAPPAKGGDMWARLGLTEGERRRVTALFSDVSGFTAMSEKLDPEEANSIMKETMAELTAIIRKHDGYVEKFIGDAICAIFGAPISHEDEPERAAHTAIEMHAALDPRAARRPDLPPLLMHIGINTGLVIAGTVGDGTQFGVMGDTVNTAARLMDKAVKTQTFVSAETARRIRHQFLLTDMGQYQMKGKDLPVQAFLLERELSEAEAKQARTLHAPLIGRDEELATLRSAATRTATGPDGAIALLLGDAGMGKTRLLDELTAELEDRMLVLRGSGHSVGSRPFGLIANVLEPLIDQMAEGPDKDIAKTILTGGETAELPDLGAALGRGLAHAAQARPVAILVDRFEWADQASVDLAVLLMRRVGTARVMVVLASRPGAAPVEAIALVGPSWVTRLRLPPLSNERTAELLQELLPGGVSPELATKLATRADGNPAFAEEIALSLVDEGVVVQTEGEWTLVGDPESVEIPSTIQELIEARIDALPDASRLVLQEASVIGNTFTVDLLCATATHPETVPGALAELAVAELLRAPSDVDEDQQYGFKSPVVREVAYQSILHRRRPAYHRRVAEALVAQQADAEGIVELLAHHYLNADDPENGVKYLDLAAARARAASAHRTAEQMLSRALTLAARHPGTIADDVLGDLHERRGYSHMVLDDREGAVDDLAAASKAHATAHRTAERIEIDERLAWFLVLSHRIDEGAAHADRIRAEAEAVGLSHIVLRLDALRSLVRALQGDLAGAIELGTEVTSRADASDDVHAKAKAAIVMGGLWRWQGELASARALLEPATEAARGLTFPVLSGLASRWLILTLVDAGDWQAVEQLASALLVRGDEAGDIHTAATAHHSMGVMARELGDLARADKSGETALASATEGRVRPAERVTMVLSLAASALRRGDHAAAESRLQQAATLVAEDPWLNWRLQALLGLAQGRLALAQGDADAALAAAARARASLGDAGARIERARAALLEAEASASAGRDDSTEKLLEALTMAREIDNAGLLADAALAVARLAPEAAPDARALVETAVARIREVVPEEWKDEFAASSRVVALAELTS